jgi:hypothetical protein
MRIAWPAALALSLTLSAPTLAQDASPTGLNLVERCYALSLMAESTDATTDPKTRENYGYCLGYVVGFVSGFAGRDALGAAGRFCPPVDARVSDFVGAIQDWLVGHPEGLEQLGALVTLRAFQARFPCPPEALKDPSQ